MLTIGSRGSRLALAQTEWVKTQMLRQFPDLHIAIKIIRTSGDRDTKSPIHLTSATGVFVKEIEEALLTGDINLAVHSMKDVPTRMPDALEISAVPLREDPRDALVAANSGMTLENLPLKAIVGTGSIRRQAQLLAMRPDLQVIDLRGNVDTRFNKLHEGKYHAIILACAGLNRLGLHHRISQSLDLCRMLPAPGQGALAIQSRKEDLNIFQIIKHLHHPATGIAVAAERAFLHRAGGGCSSPIAAFASVDGATLSIEALIATPDGTRCIRRSLSHPSAGAEQAGEILADQMLSLGGRDILYASH